MGDDWQAAAFPRKDRAMVGQQPSSSVLQPIRFGCCPTTTFYQITIRMSMAYGWTDFPFPNANHAMVFPALALGEEIDLLHALHVPAYEMVHTPGRSSVPSAEVNRWLSLSHDIRPARNRGTHALDIQSLRYSAFGCILHWNPVQAPQHLSSMSIPVFADPRQRREKVALSHPSPVQEFTHAAPRERKGRR